MISSTHHAGNRVRIGFSVAALVIALLPSAATADTSSWSEVARLVSPDPQNTFAGHVAVAGNTVAASEDGLVYVFEGAANPVRLSPSNDVGVLPVGSLLAMTETLIALGTTDGVYVFERNQKGWRETARLAPVGGDDAVIRSVAVDGFTVVAGVDDAVHVFAKTRRGWQQQATLTSGEEDDGFGGDVAIASGLIAVSAVGAEAAYVFRSDGRGRWHPEARLEASDSERLGSAVAVGDGTVMVGAGSAKSGELFAVGAVYVFAFDGGTWSERAKLTASDPVEYAVFGWDIALSGGFAVIGAPGGIYETAGAAYVFRYVGEWVEETKLVASAPPAHYVDYSFFGTDVAIDRNTIAAGAPFDSGTGQEFLTGAAYVFRSE